MTILINMSSGKCSLVSSQCILLKQKVGRINSCPVRLWNGYSPAVTVDEDDDDAENYDDSDENYKDAAKTNFFHLQLTSLIIYLVI